MSIGAGPNAAGGLWMGPSPKLPMELGNSAQWYLPEEPCGGSGGGNTGGDDSCGCGNPGAMVGERPGGGLSWQAAVYTSSGASCTSGGSGMRGSGSGVMSNYGWAGKSGSGSFGDAQYLKRVGIDPLPLPVLPICTPPAGGPIPVAIPDAATAFCTVNITAQESKFHLVSGLPVYCPESGATVVTECTAGTPQATFGWDGAGGVLLHFNILGGPGIYCSDGSPHNYNPASASVTSGAISVILAVTVTRI